MSEEGYASEWQTKVDSDIGSLAERMAGVESAMKNIGLRLGELVKVFDRHALMQQESTKTPWGLIIGSFTLMVVIVGGLMGAFSSGYIRDIERIEATQLRGGDRIYLHETKSGHPALTEKVDMSLKITDDLDESLQREMRLLNDTINTKVEALDKRIQREIELVSLAQQERTKSLERIVFSNIGK